MLFTFFFCRVVHTVSLSIYFSVGVVGGRGHVDGAVDGAGTGLVSSNGGTGVVGRAMCKEEIEVSWSCAMFRGVIFRRLSVEKSVEYESDVKSIAIFCTSGEREYFPKSDRRKDTPHAVPRSHDIAGPAISTCTATPIRWNGLILWWGDIGKSRAGNPGSDQLYLEIQIRFPNGSVWKCQHTTFAHSSGRWRYFSYRRRTMQTRWTETLDNK